jgi:uncharacterized protein
MRLNLKDIIRTPGASLPFSFSLDLSDLEWNGEKPISRPVQADGVVRNMAGALVLTCHLSTVLDLTCDRCMKSFSQEKEVSYETLLASQLEQEDSDEIVLLDNDQLDADELFRDVFVLAMDSKHLCSEDCKGLCPGCGADLNAEPCRCEKEIDPRLAGLAQFFERDP